MTQDEIDTMWQKAMQESIKYGELFTRYHFAKLVAAKALAEHAMRETQRLGQEIEQEPPKYSFKAHWEKDGRIGVVGAVVRPDGGVHLLQDFIDPPQRTEPVACERCKQLEEHAYDLVGKLRVANIKLSMNKEKNT